MGDKTGISWTDATWNPVRGCSRISEGCRHCYAERVAARFSGAGQPYEGLATRKLKVISDDEQRVEARWTGEVRLVAEHLADPLRWTKPRRIFVNSMSDLFHEKLTDDAIDQVFAVMALTKRHTYQILTKRADRMREYLTSAGRHEAWSRHIRRLSAGPIGGVDEGWFPRFAEHIWLGVSVENQAAADERIPELLATPAKIRFLSCEPLLGPVDLRLPRGEPEHGGPDAELRCSRCGLEWPLLAETEERHECPPGFGPSIDQVIAGCESGPGARPCATAWLRDLRDQCSDAGVAYFLKQAHPWVWRSGERAPGHARDSGDGVIAFGKGSKRKPGGVIELPYLDGVQHAAFPVVP